MIEEILKAANESAFDFRKNAYPDDPLKHLFPEWVPYYRLKWAIARTLQPRSILEIGVRFGYSMLAFLDASPSARYVGIDLDSSAFGGSVGAIEWARHAAKGYRADFIIGDSTKMERFPGGHYDLIHIDGQQDGQGTMHDLMLASAQGTYVLVDGYFWSRQNFLWASEFLFRYRDLIEFYEVIPGYAGELLIKMREAGRVAGLEPVDSSMALRNVYTKDYYLLDCEGYEGFKRTYGETLEDARLEAVARLCGAGTTGKALDLGCGRGELSLELARRGFDVDAIDYSEDAIEIAREALARNPAISSSILLECNDVNQARIDGPYHIAVASDLIEHMRPSELDSLYRRVSENLAEDGLFIIHTYPNAWHYQYEYRRKLKIAAAIGAYLPVEPRTRYELLMHINEQSPRVLKRQLSKHFPHVLVWFGNPYQPGENLQRKFSIQEMRSAPDLFAVASKSPIPVAKMLSQLQMEQILEPLSGVNLRVVAPPRAMRVSSRYEIQVELRNGSRVDLKSLPPYPVHLSYHWLDSHGRYSVFDGIRTQLKPDAKSGSSQIYQVGVLAPDKPGEQVLRITLVQESIRWFDPPPESLFCDLAISSQ